MRLRLLLTILAASSSACAPALVKVDGPVQAPPAECVARPRPPMPALPVAHFDECPGYAMCFDAANAAMLRQKIDILSGALKACEGE